MAGQMRKRVCAFPRYAWMSDRMLKGFHAPQKDSSVRQKRKAGLNNYTDQSHQRDPATKRSSSREK